MKTETLETKYGKRGGDANFKKNGIEHMRKIGKKGAKSRWKNKK